MQYCLHGDIRILDLTVPADLAALKGIIETSNETVVFNLIKELNIRYFLLPKSDSQIMQQLAANSSLLDVIKDPYHFRLSASSEGWELFELVNEGSFVLGWKDDTFDRNWTLSENYITRAYKRIEKNQK